MRAKLFVAVAGSGLLLAAVPVVAHHAFAAEFDRNKPVTVHGTVTKVEWVNPHSWLWVDVKGEDGKVVNWSFEMGAPGLLLRRGWARDSVKAGIEVTVEGYRAKSGLPAASGRSVKLPDGRDLFAGSSAGDDPDEKK